MYICICMYTYIYIWGTLTLSLGAGGKNRSMPAVTIKTSVRQGDPSQYPSHFHWTDPLE